MVRKLVRDESGMTMALAVIMIVLIGVMGAGLLTFVQRDLNSVIEENKGQKALDIADAGVQAAKAHLRVDSFRQHYDMDRSNDCTIVYDADGTEVLEPGGPRVGGDNWSKATDIYTDPEGYCTPGTEDSRSLEEVGVTKDFAGGKFHVTIECYDQFDDNILTPNPCVEGAGPAPEALTPTTGENGKKFFKITSTGYDTTAGDGAIRRIEAIYTTAKRTYSPIAYWTPKNIIFSGNAVSVKRMSFFAGQSITGVRANRMGSTIADPRPGPDAIYGDWAHPPYNTTPRVAADGVTRIRDAGFAAVNYICASSQLSNCDSGGRLPPNGHNDYDSLSSPRFVRTPSNPQPTTEMTFPFNPGDSIDHPEKLIDQGLLEEMRAAASEQGNLCQVGGGNNHDPPFDPADCSVDGWTDEGAIAFVEAANTTIEYRVPKNYSLTARGIIVVNNGNFALDSNSQGFQGVVIVVGNGSTTGQYEQKGSAKLDGYVSASGNMTIRGEVDPNLTTNEVVDLNTFVDVNLWSWRELYHQ